MAKKNIFDLYNEQNPPAPSTDNAKIARRYNDAEREKVVQKETNDEQKAEPKDEKKEEPANAGDEPKTEPADAGDDDKGGENNGI